MKRLGLVIVLGFSLLLLASGFAGAADDTRVKNATDQVEGGAKKIPSEKVGEGVKETAEGVGKTASEGAKYSNEKLKEAGKAAEPPAKTAWGNARDSAVGFGHTVTGFWGISFRSGEHVDAMRRSVMRKRLITSVVGLSMLSLTACGTLTGAAVGAAGGAAIGCGTGYGVGKGAFIGTGVGAAAGAIYDIHNMNK